MRGLVTAIRTLSILPVPGREADRLADALPWFPVVGALLGWLLTVPALGLGRVPGIWAEMVAFAMLAGGVLLTGALHLDGLADCADGLAGIRTRESRLAIMKDSHVGVFGVAAIVLLLLGKYLVLARLFHLGKLLWLPTAWVASRTLPVALACCLPYARQEGTGAAFVRDGRPAHLVGAFALASLLILVGGGLAHLSAWLPVALLGLGWGWLARRRLGGVTGDVLGGAVELGETLVLAWGCLP